MNRSYRLATPLTFFSVLLFVITLPSPVQEIKAESRPDDTVAKPRVEEVKPLRFEAFPVQGAKSLQELKAKYGEDGLAVILKINRTDPGHVRRGHVLAVPETISDDLSVAPLPRELKQAASIDKLILVSRRVQAFGAYESGELVYWGPTSTGKRATPTPAGLYHTNWKSKLTRSTVDSSWVLPWCFNLDNFQGIAFHQYALPGYPASHGCVRLLEEDAKWIYHWADQWMLSDSRGSLLAHGTPVIIFGDYQYGKTPPWKRLIEDANAASVSLSEASEALAKHLEVIEARAQARQTVIASIGQD
ncbi:MAG TPA: L,D-transpeptidase [Blastocatellia bacterium]|nr:L,D-transpeptidase [Blastocatellia bacterium]